jgi:hypothetical protein
MGHHLFSHLAELHDNSHTICLARQMEAGMCMVTAYCEIQYLSQGTMLYLTCLASTICCFECQG